MDFELKVKEIKLKTFLLTGNIFDEKILNNLTNEVRITANDELSYKTHVKGHFTGFQSLVKNNDFHSFLKLIQPNIQIVYPHNFVIQNAWGNLCKINEEVTEHDHSNVGAFCGILYLSESGPGTYFKDYDVLIKEEIGKYILFHPKLKHSVDKIKSNIERITVAFNMGEVKEWLDTSKLLWVNKK